MESACEKLKELGNAIKKDLESYEVPYDDGSIWPLAEQAGSVLFYGRSVDPERLKTIASKYRTYAIDIYQQYPQQLSEPPKPETDPLVELQQIRLWCIKAEAPKQPKQEQPTETEGNTTPAKRERQSCLWKLYEITLKVIIDAVLKMLRQG